MTETLPAELIAEVERLRAAGWQCGCGTINGAQMVRCTTCTRDQQGNKP